MVSSPDSSIMSFLSSLPPHVRHKKGYENNKLFAGRVLVNKNLFTGRVLVNKKLFAGWILSNKK